jgi:hypothetical protein
MFESERPLLRRKLVRREQHRAGYQTRQQSFPSLPNGFGNGWSHKKRIKLFLEKANRRVKKKGDPTLWNRLFGELGDGRSLRYGATSSKRVCAL